MSALGNYTGSAFNQFGNTSLFGQPAGGYSAPTNLPPVTSTPAPPPPAQPAAQPTQPAAATSTPTAPSPWASFQPTYQQNGWNPQEYATDSTAGQLAGLLGGNVVKTNQGSMNNFGVPAQNNIDLGAQDTFNAGLLAQRYSSDLMPQWQKDAMTQAELARSGPYTGSPSDATNLVNRSATPTVAPLAQQAFANLAKDPVAAAQAKTPAGGTGTPAPAQFAPTTQQQQDQFFNGSQNNPANSTNNTAFLSQLQSIMPLLQLLGGFQGTSLQASQTVPSSVQQTPYGYTQWTQGIKPAGSYSGYQGTYNGSQTAPGSSNSGSNASLTQLLQLLTGNSNRGQGSGALF